MKKSILILLASTLLLGACSSKEPSSSTSSSFSSTYSTTSSSSSSTTSSTTTSTSISSSSTSSSSSSSLSSSSSSSSSTSYSSSTSITSSSTSSSSSPIGKASYTLMIYLCGADLESDRHSGGLASKSIGNILSVKGQPNDVNIIIETGGASSWKKTYGIRSDKLQRYHVKNQELILDETLDDPNNMGLSSTFQSFLEWGLTSYPAERTSVILSNHGGAMWGVCFDENNPLKYLSYDWNDGLTNDEVSLALSNAFANTSQASKLEFIGYDACLMQMQDIAEFNSKYFNYMIASQENEIGEGWNYAEWIDDLYAKKDSEVILKEICDTYIDYCVNQREKDCTMSYLNLNNMNEYFQSFENLGECLKGKITNDNRSSFINLIKSCKTYGSTDSDYYCSYDVKDFLNKLSSSSLFNPGENYIEDVLDDFASLVKYNKIGSKAGNSNGLCLFFSISSYSEQGNYYNANMTNFSAWRYLSNTYGY